MHSVKVIFLSTVAFSSACTSTHQDASFEALAKTAGVQVETAALDALTEREAMYADVFKQAERQGLLLGGLRGALVGALVKGEGGVVAGVILGALIGSSYSVSIAERLLDERDEFLNRQEIIENILNASKLAANRSSEDAELVSRALSAHTLTTEQIDAETHMKFAESVATVRRAVELRAVLIEEALREAALPDDEARVVRLEIARQMEALRRIRAQQEAWSVLSHG